VYLKQQVFPVVDHENTEEVKEFHELAFWLFGWNSRDGGDELSSGGSGLKYRGFLVDLVDEGRERDVAVAREGDGGLLGAGDGLFPVLS
jgi:hypothetical protein